jgi:hypothetical protein
MNDCPAPYEIVVNGHLPGRWASEFPGFNLHYEQGRTVLSGLLADQAALFGLLLQLRDLGVTLLALRHVDPQQPGGRQRAG